MLSQPAPISVSEKTFYQQTSRTCPIIVLVATGEERGFSCAAEAPNAAALQFAEKLANCRAECLPQSLFLAAAPVLFFRLLRARREGGPVHASAARRRVMRTRVVGCRRNLKQPLDPTTTAQFHLPESRPVLDPSEALLDQFPFLLALHKLWEVAL